MIVQPKPGNQIIVTDPKLDAAYGKRYLVTKTTTFGSKFNPFTDYIWVTGIEDQIDEIRLTGNQYEVLEEIGAKVLVGDRIIIINKSWKDDYLKIFVVLEVREKDDCILVTYEDENEDRRIRYKLPYDTFELLQRKSKASPSCPDCKGTGRILLFTSTVECSCKEIYK